MALSKLHLCALVWEAWTDIGSVGAGRRAILRKSDNFSQELAQPRVDPTSRCSASLEAEESDPERPWKTLRTSCAAH